MIQFERLEGPYGIPVYFQRLPSIVKSVSLKWLVLVGSADDETVGGPGLYHWFEHVPFRGTRKYPHGYADTADRFTRFAGTVGAYTTYDHTVFQTHVPKRLWRDALDLITDLVAHPLLRLEDINAEREIILQELGESLSRLTGFANYHTPNLLWPGHPFGHPIIGSEETLLETSPVVVHQAHTSGYSRSRCVLFAAGNIDEKELAEAVSACAETLPNSPLSERRGPVSYGSPPAWKEADVTEIETDFSSSLVGLGFRIAPSKDAGEKYWCWNVLAAVLGEGVQSPLFRITREERKLVYHVDVEDDARIDGGTLACMAQTENKNISALQQAFWDALRDPQTRSVGRWNYVQDVIRTHMDMLSVNPADYTSTAVNRLMNTGAVWSDRNQIKNLAAVSREEVMHLLDSLTPERGRTIIFRGHG